MSRLYIVNLIFKLLCRVHHVKCQAGWSTSWNQDCWENYQQPQICRWHHPYGWKWRRTKEPLDENERGNIKSWLKTQHSGNEDHGIQSHHFMGNRWENSVNNDRRYFGGSKITEDGDCRYDITRHRLLGRKDMTNLDSILKSRDITLPTKVCLVKAMAFPVVMYGCESWTLKKAVLWRIDAFELWCWRRLLRVPWTEWRSNHPILKEISPEYSLEALKLKLQYFGHLMQRTDSFEKTLMLGKIEGGRRRGWKRIWCLDVIINWWTWVWASLGVGYRQRGLVCCSPWIRKSWTPLSNCTDWSLHEMITLSFSQSVGTGIFFTQGSNPGLLHCRWFLYQLSH